MSPAFLDEVYYGNSLQQYLVAAGVAAATMILTLFVRSLVTQRLATVAARTETSVDDIALEVVRATRFWAVLLLTLYLGSFYLDIIPEIEDTVQIVAITTLLIQIGIWCTAGVKATVQRIHDEKTGTGDTAGLGALQMMSLLGRLVAWVVILLLILANLGVNITALIAGLGIGGIAVALALQNVLSDLFASVSIVLDKPFEVGDFMAVDDYLGTVEAIGMKTTRVRSLSGEQLVFANNDLLTSRIRNYKRLRERRIVFSFGVTYQTTAEKLAKLSQIVEDIVDRTDRTRFDRAHFKAFGASSLDFEVVYFMLDPDYNLFMDAQQRINLELYTLLESEGIEFAYPTQTLYLNQAA